MVDQSKPQSWRYRRHFDDPQERFEGKDRVSDRGQRSEPGAGHCYLRSFSPAWHS